MRKSSNSKNNHLRRRQFDLLIEAISEMRTQNDLVMFFRSLMTESERAIIEQRLDIMRMLILDKNYQEIKLVLGVSPSTITNAAKSLRKSRKILREMLLNWKSKPDSSDLKEGEGKIKVTASSTFGSGNFFQAIKPGVVRRVHKIKH